jgi:hypothetical protein
MIEEASWLDWKRIYLGVWDKIKKAGARTESVAKSEV